MRALGVDPGTGSMDLLAFDDNGMRVLYEEAVPRSRVTRNPEIIINKVKKIFNNYLIDSIVAPSGYGIPLKRVQEASIGEIRHATFITCDDEKRGLQIVGLRRLMMLFRESSLPAWFTPGAIHLPTIPHYRKANRIDMGTADKVFTVAAAMAAENMRDAVRPGDINIVVVEAGLAYTSAILVEAGEITDAVAGTAGFWGFLGGGFMDSELAYALAAARPGFSKALLFQGGVSSVFAIQSPTELETLLSRGDARGLMAANMIAEAILKDIGALLASTDRRIRRVYLSGRLVRMPRLGSLIKGQIRKLPYSLEMREPLSLGTRTKEGATGAALIANGLAGGKFSWIVDSLRLGESSGSVFDWITDSNLASEVKEFFSRDCP